MRFDGQDTVTKRPAGEVDTESDCEIDSTGAGEGMSALRQDDSGEGGGQVRAILNPGSFAT